MLSVVVAVAVVDCRVDVFFVIDLSVSIGSSDNFDDMKSFISDLVIGRLNVGSCNTRVGVVSHSTRRIDSIDLNEHSSEVSDLQCAILSLRYRATPGETNTGDALEHIRLSMLTPAAGDRGDVPNVVLVLTAGFSNDPSKTRVRVKYHFEFFYR